MDTFDEPKELKELLQENDPIDSRKHTQLVRGVLALKGTQGISQITRSEISSKRSEFDGTDQLEISTDGLGYVSQKKRDTKRVTDRLRQFIKPGIQKTVARQLEKPQRERMKRGYAYEKASLRLDRWQPLVTANRTALHASFPLPCDLKLKEPADFTAGCWRLKSDLERTVEELHKQPVEEPISLDATVDAKHDKIGNGETSSVPVDLKQMLRKRKEMAQMRAYESRLQAKGRRQGQIKSKRFHRIEKRQRVRKALLEFEKLQKSAPDEALRKLEEIDKVRALERFTLRHRSTGKWAQNRLIRSKYDTESRKALSEQLALSRDLTEKVNSAQNADNDTDTDEDNENYQNIYDATEEDNLDPNNIWSSAYRQDSIQPGKEVQQFVSKVRKFNAKQSVELSDDDHPSTNSETTDIVENTTDIFSSSAKSLPKTSKSTENARKTTLAAGNLKKRKKSDTNTTTKHSNSISNKQIKHTATKQMTNGMTKRTNKVTKQTVGTKKLTGAHKQASASTERPKQSKNGDKSRTNPKLISTTTNWKVMDVDQMFDAVEAKIVSKQTKKRTRLSATIMTNRKPKRVVVPKMRRDRPTMAVKPLRGERLRPVIDEPMIESTQAAPTEDETVAAMATALLELDPKATAANAVERKSRKTSANTNQVQSLEVLNGVDIIESDRDDDGEHEKYQQLASEAFEDDCVVKEFEAERRAQQDEQSVENLLKKEPVMPGWGGWAGAGLRPKQQKVTTATKPATTISGAKTPRQVVFVNETANRRFVREHQVNEIPFPFRSVRDFEASIRAPIGNTFVAEQAFRRNIQPAVTTKMGTIISPASREMLPFMRKPKVK